MQPSGVGPGCPQTAARRRGVDRLAAFMLTHPARSLSCPRSGPFAAAHHGVRALSCEFTLWPSRSNAAPRSLTATKL
jgi:hypothetical protein